jgi:hypothetical protein
MPSRLLCDRDESADELLIDSGASSHMSATEEIMIDAREIPERDLDSKHANAGGSFDVEGAKNVGKTLHSPVSILQFGFCSNTRDEIGILMRL